jgi:hypothetical protein
MARSITKLFDCADLNPFMNSIVSVLQYKGASMSRFYNCVYKGVAFFTKVHFYRKNACELCPGAEHKGKKQKPTRASQESLQLRPQKLSDVSVVNQIEAEIAILNVFRDKLVRAGHTWCIIELVYSRICDRTIHPPKRAVCTSAITNPSQYNDMVNFLCKHADMVRAGLSDDKCAFLVLDQCDITLDVYLLKYAESPVGAAVFKSLLFQIIHCIWIIQKKYPGFRHYDLHTENIMLKVDHTFVFDATRMQFLAFTINGVKYRVPYFGIIPKIIDFGFSILPEENIYSEIAVDKLKLYFRSENDLLFLFHWIYHIAEGSAQIKSILHQLEPSDIYIDYYTPHIRAATGLKTYDQMIRNDLWKDYRTHASGEVFMKFKP